MVRVAICETGQSSSATRGKLVISFIRAQYERTADQRLAANSMHRPKTRNLLSRSVSVPPAESVATARVATGELEKGETPSTAKYKSSSKRPQVEALPHIRLEAS